MARPNSGSSSKASSVKPSNSISHLTSERVGLQSTKPQSNIILLLTANEQEQDYYLPLDTSNIKYNQVCYTIISSHNTIAVYINLAGRFPRRSSRRDEYIIVGYHYNTNCIYGVPIKNRKGSTITEVQNHLYDICSKARVALNACILDNEPLKNLTMNF